DRMRLRAIEADVVQAAEVLALRQHVLAVEVDPPAPLGFALALQQQAAGRRRQLRVLDVARPGELGRDHRADTDARGPVVAAIAQFDVIARIAAAITGQRLEGLALVPD